MGCWSSQKMLYKNALNLGDFFSTLYSIKDNFIGSYGMYGIAAYFDLFDFNLGLYKLMYFHTIINGNKDDKILGGNE